MADISDKIQRIQSAIYGRDVRESIAAGMEAINEESESAKISATQSEAAAKQSAEDAVAAKDVAETAAANAAEKSQLAQAAADAANTATQAARAVTDEARTATEEANVSRDAANTAAQNAQAKAQAAREATAEATAAATGANSAATAANDATASANAATQNAKTQADYAKGQGDRANQLLGKIESTDIGGMAADILGLQNGKVDKENGKGLSSEDFTTAEKEKLAGIAQGANKTIVDASLSSSSANPIQNMAVKAGIDEVQAAVSAHMENKSNPHGVTAAQVGAVPVERTINGKSLTTDIKFTPEDIGIVSSGNAWNEIVLDGSHSLKRIIQVGDALVIIDLSGRAIFTSADGINWKRQDFATFRGDAYAEKPVFFNGHWYLIGTRRKKNPTVLRSPDGFYWEEIDPGIENAEAGFYAVHNGTFFVFPVNSGNVFMYTDDGEKWTEGTLPHAGKWEAPILFNGYWFSLPKEGGTYGIYSANGKTWTSVSLPISALTAWEITLGSNIAVAVPVIRYSLETNTDYLIYSTTATSWTKVSIPSGDWEKPIFHDGVWILGTKRKTDQFFYSLDGKDWSPISLPVCQPYSYPPIYNGALWVMMPGVDGSLPSNENGYGQYSVYSMDGVTWEIGTDFTVPTCLKAPVYANNIFVTVYPGYTNKAYYSEDGITWICSTLPTGSQWDCITFIDSKWYLHSYNYDNPYIMQSCDGKTWEMIPLPSPTGVNNILKFKDTLFLFDSYDSKFNKIVYSKPSLSSSDIPYISCDKSEPHYVKGSFTGNGAVNRTIDLGFTPSMVIVFGLYALSFKSLDMDITVSRTSSYAQYPYGRTYYIVDSGFLVSTSEGANAAYSTNANGIQYSYIAFR